MTNHSCLSFPPDDPVASQLGLGAAALRYQQMGYAVLPLARAAKKPHRMLPYAGEGRDGVYWATRDPAMPQWAWPQDRAAGIGIATGQASNLVVIDLDVKGMHNGLSSWVQFLATHALNPGDHGLPWPENVPTVATPSGGAHLYLGTPPMPVPQRLGILPGVDIKGDGGYVAAPMTMITVQTLDGEPVLLPYQWVGGCPCSVPEAPRWLFEWIASAAPSAAEGSGGSAGPAVDLGVLRETGLAQGSRNAGLYRLACSLYARYGTGPDGQAAAWEQIGQVLERTDTRGFGRGEIATILASAQQFVTRSREREAKQTEAARRWLTR